MEVGLFMTHKPKITSSQLFSLMVLFELGSAIVIGVGTKAKQDAWLAILLGMVGGSFLFLSYHYIYKNYPELSFSILLQRSLGKIPGKALALLYIFYFMYIAARVLRDFGELLVTTALPETPIAAANLFIMLVVAYGSYLGIEVLGRSGEIFFVVFMFLGFLFPLLAFAAGLPKGENLLPILEQGWKPVLTTAFPVTLTFPFGETVVFMMFFSNLGSPGKVLKVGEAAIMLSGLILSSIIALNISILGPTIIENATFPLLKSLGKVSIGNFIQRLDSIAITLLIVGGFFKIAVFTFAAICGMQDILNIKKRFIIIFVGITVFVASLNIASNVPEHLEIGLKLVPIYLHLPFQIGIPLILCIIIMIRNRFAKK